MAKALPLILLCFAGLVVMGCQKQAAQIDTLPKPNLNGPVVVVPKPPATRPVVAPAPVPVQAAKPPVRRPDVPADWVPPIPANHWRWIVIHHSATPGGSALVFDREHRAKGWDELGYHFVIGNGLGSRDGQVEVGTRWPKQKWGAHAKTADQEFNNYGIGICLVGNFDIDRPTPAQVRSLARLTAYLMKTYHIPPDHVIGHGETKPTDCPGRNCSVVAIRQMAIQIAREEAEGIMELAPVRTASRGELLHEVGTR
jgi:hypothetical protein